MRENDINIQIIVWKMCAMFFPCDTKKANAAHKTHFQMHVHSNVSFKTVIVSVATENPIIEHDADTEFQTIRVNGKDLLYMSKNHVEINESSREDEDLSENYNCKIFDT